MRKLAICLPALFFYLSLSFIFQLFSNQVQAQLVSGGAVDTSSWVKCADEDQICAFAGSKSVRYGANEQFVYKDLFDSTLCSNSVFGDPLYGVIKACYLLEMPTPSKPSVGGDGTTNSLNWDVLADHYEVDIQLDDGAWLPDATTYTTSPATWNNLDAGSRAYRIRACNAENLCSRNSPTSEMVITAPYVEEWMKCAEEGQLCVFEGNGNVRYGANEQFVYKDIVDGTSCSNAVFGDPIAGVIKACYILQIMAEPTSDSINFSDYVIGSYGGSQDTVGSTNIVDSGTGLELTGNLWKQVNFPYTVTANTVIEFDFSSSVQGEIHGIGFDTDTSTIDAAFSFQLFGNQNWGLNTYQNYVPGNGVKHYRIPVGSHYIGAFSYLYFVMDEDTTGNTTANGTYSNVRIYEASTEPTDEIPANAYYFLNARWVGQAVNIIGLSDNTSIDVGGVSQNINAGETLSYTVQNQGETIFANKPFSIGTASDGLDMPVPSSFAGLQFVIPQIRESHYYYLLSPAQNTMARIRVGANTQEVELVAGQVYRHSAGSSTVEAGIINADVPILISHSSAISSYDPYPVPPATTELWGIRTINAYVAALQNDTTVQVWASNGTQQSIMLNAGEINEVTVGFETSEGAGSAIRLVADKPIAAIQHADSDGAETTAFLTQVSFATDYIIPVDSQYVAMVCNTPNTNIELRDVVNVVIDRATCHADGTNPGKAYFGNITDGKWIAAGSKIVASQPVYLIYETAVTSDEHNLLGYSPTPLVDISYSGSGDITYSTDIFLARATPTQGNKDNIDTVEFSINGTLWFATDSVNSGYEYNFGQLLADNYTLYARVNGTVINTIAFSVVAGMDIPGKVKGIHVLESEIIQGEAFTFAWLSQSDTTYYILYVNSVARPNEELLPEATLTLIGAGEYNIQVQACNLDDCGALSDNLLITVLGPPGQVQNIAVQNVVLIGQVTPLNWAVVSDATYYEVSIDGVVATSPQAATASLNFPQAGTYLLTVRACNQVGCGPSSASINVFVGANTGPLVTDVILNITQLKPSVSQDLALLVSDVDGINWPSLQLVMPAFGQVTVLGSLLTIDYTSVHLDAQDRIEYRVNDALGAPSNTGFIILNVNILQTPEIPSQLIIAELSPAAQLSFSWQGPQAADIRYRVEHQTNENPWQVIQKTTIEHQATLINPLNGIHRFKVRACNLAHNVCSNYVQSAELLVANTPYPVAGVLPPIVNSAEQIRLQWLASNNTAYYKVEQRKDQQGWELLQGSIVGTMLLVDVEGNGQFEFKVYACNAAGCSSAVNSGTAEISIIPATPAIANLLEVRGQYQLSWSVVDSASWYLVQQQINSQWQGVKSNDTQMHYFDNTLLLEDGAVNTIRVLACSNAGCSEPILAALVMSDSYTINAFYADRNVLRQVAEKATLYWDVTGANQVRITADNGQFFGNLSAKGSLMVSPEQTAVYTLHMNVSDVPIAYPHPIKVIVGIKPAVDTTVLSNNVLISPIISSILIEPGGERYFGDLQGSLINMDTNGVLIWRLDEVGMLSSPPVMSQAGPLYFTANRISGLGQLCHVSQAGDNLHCISLSQPIIGAPVLDGNYALIVDLYGGALSVNLLTDEVTMLSQLPTGKQVRSTPLLTPNNTLVVRTTESEIYTLDLNSETMSVWTQLFAGEQP